MPTYVCSVPNGKLSDLQKQETATAIVGIARRPARHVSSCRLSLRSKGHQSDSLVVPLPIITFGYVAIYERDVTKSSVGKSC